MYVYIDIETIPGQRNEAREIAAARVTRPGTISRPETIEAWEREKRPDLEDKEWRKSALAGTWGEIVCITWALEEGLEVPGLEPLTTRRRMGARDEVNVLEGFFADMRVLRLFANNRQPTWVGYNITGFDLRFIWQRAIACWVRPTVKLRQDAKPWGDEVVDLMSVWCGTDPGKRIKLAELCAALRIDVGHEDTIDGSQVWDCYQAGDMETIVRHCEADVKRVRELHARILAAG